MSYISWLHFNQRGVVMVIGDRRGTEEQHAGPDTISTLSMGISFFYSMDFKGYLSRTKSYDYYGWNETMES